MTSTRASSTGLGQVPRGNPGAPEEARHRPAQHQLTPKPDIVKDWDKLTPDEKKVCIRYQEVFAAFAELTDYEIGRVVQAVEDMGVMDNTLIIYVTGDNGASPNGGRLGASTPLALSTRCPRPWSTSSSTSMRSVGRTRR